MNNCKACGGTGLQWMGDFSIGTEYQDTCVVCNGKREYLALLETI